MKKKNTSGLFIFLVAMLLAATIAARTPLDTDMWWHIRSGEITIQNGSPLMIDSFSFTRAGTPWTNHSWLAQVLLYLVFKAGGFTGLAIYTVLLAVMAMALVYRLLQGPPLLKAFLTIFCAAACAMVWTPRPQMFSLVFFIGLYSLLLAYKREKRKILWAIPILFAVWSNLHGGFPIGLALIIVFTAAEAANRLLFYPEAECLSWKEIRSLVLWGLSAVPALLLNPNGIKTWLIPFETVGVTALQNLIQEWASPDFHQLSQQVILWLFFMLILSFALAGRRMPLGELLIPLTFAYMTFLARRNIAPFAMTAIPALSRGMLADWETWQEKLRAWDGFERVKNSPWLVKLAAQNREVNPAVSRLINDVIIAFLAVIAFGRLGVMSLNPIVERYMEKDFPVQAVHFLEANQISGRLFNEYNWGGYLVFSRPQNPVFVDGRTDLFGDEIINEWQKVVYASEDWQAVLDKWDVHVVMLAPDRPVIRLMKDQGWETVFEDEKAVVMRQP